MDAQQILIGAQETMTVRRLFGEPIQVDGATIIPVAELRGGGGGGANGLNQSGVGFGVQALHAGVYVVRKADVALRPAVDINLLVLGGLFVDISALLIL